MKLSVRLLTIALVAVPAVPALAVTTAGATAKTAAAAAAPVYVARYTFDAGVSATGRVAENSGRGSALTVRVADRGTVRFLPSTTGRYAGFPGRCATGAATCPRALLEGTDDADLDPGIRPFRWGAQIFQVKSQLAGSSNVMQKGAANTESQWKMQIGATHGRAQCVVVGRGNPTPYIVRSSVTVADSKWHHVQCVRVGGAMAIYVDGVARGRVAVPPTLSIENNRPLRIGGPNFNTNSDMFHGYLDNAYAILG